MEQYRQIAIENPGRVCAVYIRDVTSERRDRQIKSLAADLKRRGVPTLLAASSEVFAEDMQSRGLISRGAVERVRQAMAASGSGGERGEA
jgi:phosphatidate phosphatase APP1